MQLYMRASARLCRAAACQPALRRPLAALAGAREHCTRHAVLPQGPVASLGRWQPPSGGGGSAGGGCRLGSALLQPRQLLHSTRCQAMAFTEADIAADVGVMVEGEPAGISEKALEGMCEALYNDSVKVLKQAALFLLSQEEERDGPPAPLELSLVLCDDAHIQELNREWRGVDAPTDVLSFELEDDEEVEGGASPELPVNVLGDVVISLDTARRQAGERGYSLADECRVLLVHGVLHLLGFDHEESEEDAEEMAAAEKHTMQALGWKGQGLIAAAGSADGLHGDPEGGSGDGSGGGGSRGA